MYLALISFKLTTLKGLIFESMWEKITNQVSDCHCFLLNYFFNHINKIKDMQNSTYNLLGQVNTLIFSQYIAVVAADSPFTTTFYN